MTRIVFINIAILCAMGILVEVGLRIWTPPLVKFAHDIKEAYNFHHRWYVDFAPHKRSHLYLEFEGQPFYNFVISTDGNRFRIPDRPFDHPPYTPENAYIHAIGDSFTMGWGVPYASSYPNLLAQELPSRQRVLNLGLNGYGVRSATEKSMELWQRFPASHVVYLFYPNDFLDDEKAARFEEMPSIVHELMHLLTGLRRTSYLVNVPFAVRYRSYLKGIETNRANLLPEKKADPTLEAEFTQDEVGDCHTVVDNLSTRSFKKYLTHLKDRETRLLILVADNATMDRKPEFADAGKQFYRFAKCHHEDTYILDVPPSLRLRHEGHFNALGNAAVARLVRRWIEAEL